MAKQTLSKPAEAEVRAMIASWAQAIRSRNADGVVACRADDLVQFDFAPPLRVMGPDAKGLQDWFATWRGQIGYEIKDLHVTVGDDLGFGHCLIHLTGNRTDGSKSNVWFRNTLCLRRSGDGWKIAHGHESVPMRMDGSFKAAVDLEP
jgi:PhnB protein